MYMFQSVSLDITYKCNLKCRHCYNFSGEYLTKELSDSQLKEIIGELAKQQVESICFCGGETMLRFNLILEMAQILKEISPKTFVSMVSNGLLWTHDKAVMLKSAGVDYVQFSLDGLTDEAYDFVRGSQGQLQKVFNAIDFAKNAGLKVMVSTLPHKMSYLQVPEIIKFCKEKKIDEFRMQPLMPLGRGDSNYEDLRISDDQYSNLKKLLAKESSDFFKVEWGDPVDHFFMLQEVPYIASLNINAFGEILISPYLPFSIWDLKSNSFNEFLTKEIPRKALQNEDVLEAISNIVSVDDMLGVNEAIQEITKLNERETIDLSFKLMNAI